MILVCDGYEDKYEKIGGIIKASYTDQGIRGFHVIDSDSTTFTLYQASRDMRYLISSARCAPLNFVYISIVQQMFWLL